MATLKSQSHVHLNGNMHLFSCILFSINVAAEKNNSVAVNLAHDIGFYGCDNEIDHVFRKLHNSDNFYITTSYRDKTKDKIITCLASYGLHSGLQKTTFIQDETSCVAYTILNQTDNRSCPKILADEKLKFVEKQGDTIWATDSYDDKFLLSDITLGCRVTISRDITFNKGK